MTQASTPPNRLPWTAVAIWALTVVGGMAVGMFWHQTMTVQVGTHWVDTTDTSFNIEYALAVWAAGFGLGLVVAMWSRR